MPVAIIILFIGFVAGVGAVLWWGAQHSMD
jgi:hypothetical protein